jgi:uncharacterized protein YifE (UPF0438 family)
MTLKYEDLAEDEQYFIDKIRGLSQPNTKFQKLWHTYGKDD